MRNTKGPAVIFKRSLGRDVQKWAPWYFGSAELNTRPVAETSPARGRVPSGSNWDPVTDWANAMEALGLTDPTTATKSIEQRKEVRKQGELHRDEGYRENLASDIATGDFDWNTLRERAREAALDELVSGKVSSAINNAIDAAELKIYNAALTDLRKAGEAVLIGQVLKPEVERIVQAARSGKSDIDELQKRWDLIAKLTHVLRLLVLPNEGGKHWPEWMLQRPDLAREWRLNNCETVTAHDTLREVHDGVMRVSLRPDETAPPLDLRAIAEHADEWKPSVYTAHEVVEHSLNLWNT